MYSLDGTSATDGLQGLADLAVTMDRAQLEDFGTAAEAYNWVASASYGLCRAIDRLLQEGEPRDSIAPAIEPARRAMAASPFVRRLQEWPRGYPGDFETIEYLCDAENRAPKASLGFQFEQFFLSTAPAVQHRNKLQKQTSLIVETILAKPTANILILACGGARDLLDALPVALRSGARFHLNDIDEDALEMCRRRFHALGNRLVLLPGNALTVTARLEEEQYDLIVCGGLFDYIPSPLLKRLVRSLRRLLVPGGRLFVTNVVDDNPYRSWLEFCANWRLIGRSAVELVELFPSASFPYSEVVTGHDSTRLAHFLLAVR